LSPLLQRFAERMPLPVMAKALLHHCFEPDTLDRLYQLYADRQYEHQLLFSDLFALMTAVVLRQQKSVRAAYLHTGQATLGATLAALYDKLSGLELPVLTGLLDYHAERCQELLEQLALEREPLLAGVAGVRILDGNTLQGRQHRLKETRNSRAAPLPGKSLAVLDPERQLILQWLPCADGHTQERALFPELLTQVKPGELWDDWLLKGVCPRFIPPYCPELNLIEILWRKVKYEWLPLHAYQSSFEHVKATVIEVLDQVGEKFSITQR
ncbi:MAG: transposase, partial [Thiolinea sp.]